MQIAYFVLTAIVAFMATFSAVGKIRRDPHQVTAIHETVGVPLTYFSLLAACEFAGAVGLVAGIWWHPLGVVAGAELVVYFVGAVVSHLRVRDIKGIGPAAFMLFLAAATLILRILTSKPDIPGQ